MTTFMQPPTELIPFELGRTDLPESALPHSPISALASMRRDALERFHELGIPTLKHEEWRYTNLKRLASLPLLPASAVDVSPATVDVDRLRLPELDGPRIVFINGRFSASHSTLAAIPETIRVRRLAEAPDDFPAERFGALTSLNDDAFAALNTAMFEDLVIVHAWRNAHFETPILILNIVTSPGVSTMVNPRTIVIAEEGARLSVVEDFVGVGDEVHFTNALTEVFVGPDADVSHYSLARESRGAFNINTLNARQERDSRFSSHSVLLGGAVVRNNVNPKFDGENCWGLLNGIYIGDGTQHLDNHMRVEHNQPNCDSRQYYKGIMLEKAHGVFTGRIIVAKGAQKTDAVQSSQGILLSNSAQIQNRPQLEIYADDVKCTHGATVGQLDEDALFYFRSRGIDPIRARALLTFAFVSEGLDRMADEPVRRAVTELLLDKLPDSRFLEDVVS